MIVSKQYDCYLLNYHDIIIFLKIPNLEIDINADVETYSKNNYIILTNVC